MTTTLPSALSLPRSATAALVCGALLFVTGCSKQPVVPPADEGRALTDRFLELVRTGKAAQAWDDTSTDFKSAEGRESFARSMKRLPWINKPLTFQSVETIESPVGARAEYLYQSADAAHRVRLLVAARDDGHWCVERLQVD